MTEFSLTHDGFTHGALADGGNQRLVLEEGRVTIGRFGIFSFYQLNASGSLGRCRVLKQPQTEVRLIFISKGATIQVGCDGTMKSFAAGESNCLLVTAGCEQDLVITGDGPAELFMLVMNLSDISSTMTGSQSHLRDFLEAKRCRWLLAGQNLVLGIRKVTVIQQILHEKKPAYLQAVYIQLKLAELFVLFLEKAGTFGDNGALARLRPEERERMRRVRDMLHDNPAATYSLVGLAHAVGTNETTLKTHFKAVYGVTVFGYLIACRMERAKALLAEGNLKVASVAQEVGYKYASHFSTAFRKYFGYLPTKIVRMFVSFQVGLSVTESAEVIGGCLLFL